MNKKSKEPTFCGMRDLLSLPSHSTETVEEKQQDINFEKTEFLTPFEFVKNCYIKEYRTASDKWQFAQHFPTIRMLSFFPNMLKPMAKMSKLQTGLPDWAMGCTLFNLVPKSRYFPKSNKYISAKSTTEEDSLEIENIKKIYCVGNKHAEQLSLILKQENLSLGMKGKSKKRKKK